MRKNFCILFLLSAAASLLSGCRQCRPVEVERIENIRSVDTLERLCWRFDSIPLSHLTAIISPSLPAFPSPLPPSFLKFTCRIFMWLKSVE